jgi:hypothetical protein
VSRSNPNENGQPNPSTRWFEWNGEQGVIRYYDKDAKQNVDVGNDFTFLLLDQLGKVSGWHEASESGIFSNEVKDTRADVLVVKAFKATGGPLAEGLYKDIKDHVHTLGGQFVASCYIGYKTDDGLAIGNIGFKGAALSAWMDFTKSHRSDLYSKAIQINGFTEGKKGRITYRVPVFSVAGTTPETDRAAVGLDAQLQSFLKHYLAKNKRDQVEASAPHVTDEDMPTGEPQPPPYAPSITDDDIPF